MLVHASMLGSGSSIFAHPRQSSALAAAVQASITTTAASSRFIGFLVSGKGLWLREAVATNVQTDVLADARKGAWLCSPRSASLARLHLNECGAIYSSAVHRQCRRIAGKSGCRASVPCPARATPRVELA